MGRRDDDVARDGDWGAIIAQYQEPLCRYAARLVGDADRGRDVVQDAFARLCGTAAPPVNGKVVEWLYTVCRSRALDVRAKEARMSSLTEEHAQAVVDRAANPTAAAEQRETAASALAALATLPERQQELVRLKFEHNLSYKQIAAVTGLTVTNVGYLLHTTLQQLRARLADS